MKAIYVILLSWIISVVTLYAKSDIITVTGEYTFYGESCHSRITCENIALENARISAIEKEFGISVSQEIVQKDTESNTYFASINNTELQGEWINDIDPPKFKYMLSDNGCYIVTCTVKGNIRKISNTNNIDIEAILLKNGTTPSHISNQFKSNDDLYVYFKSPVDGYVAIFIIGDSQRVYRILPYSTGNVCEIKVNHDTPYIFFSKKYNKPEHGIADELILVAQNDDLSIEYNTMYVVFSTNPFTKPIDNVDKENIPPKLTYENFNKWLKSNCVRDKNMVIKKIYFTLTGK